MEYFNNCAFAVFKNNMVYMNIDSFKLQLLISYTGTLFDFFKSI